MSTPSSQAAVIVTLAALSALSTLSTSIVLPVLPEIVADLRATPDSASSVLWAFLAVFGVGQLVVGPLADRWGRRRVLWLGLAVFVLGSVTAGLADSLAALLTGRALQGFGAAAASMLARAVASDLFEGPQLARTLGWVMAMMAAAPGFSPLLGALIGSAWGWRSTLLALVVICVVAAAAHQVFIGETLPTHRRRQAGSVRSVGRAYVGLVRDERFRPPALASALTMAGLFALFGASPIVLRNQFGVSTFGIGVFFALTVFAVFAAANRAPTWSRRLGPVGLIRLGLGLCVAAAALLAASLTTDQGLFVYGMASALFLFGMGLVNPTATALALTPFAAQAGQASALLGFLQMAGATIALLVLPYIPLPPASSLAAVLASSAALGLVALRKPRLRANAQA